MHEDMYAEGRLVRLETIVDTAPTHKDLTKLRDNVRSEQDAKLDAVVGTLMEQIKTQGLESKEANQELAATTLRNQEAQHELGLQETRRMIREAFEEYTAALAKKQAEFRSKMWSVVWSLISILMVVLGANLSQSRFIGNVMSSLNPF